MQGRIPVIERKLGWLACVGLVLSLISGCQKHSNLPAATLTLAQESSGLSPDQVTTLNSLERVDDYPLYVMHYKGAYSSTGFLPRQEAGLAWGCTLFAAMGDENRKFFGRNFDWQFSPAVLLFTNPPDGYASVSMVDIAYLGFTDGAENLAEMPLLKKQALLRAPYLPFDGMNEYGLAIGMAAVPEHEIPREVNRAAIDSLGIIREVLDHARTVDEATELFGKYNIEWGSGPSLHYLVADAGGNAALIEFSDGEMVILPNQVPWHLATNHLRVSARGDGGCYRYAQVHQALDSTNGKLTLQEAIRLLAEVSQGGDYPTQWSIIYGLTTGEINVVMGRDEGQVHRYNFPLLDQ